LRLNDEKFRGSRLILVGAENPIAIEWRRASKVLCEFEEKVS
jgi:hypothetical protein